MFKILVPFDGSDNALRAVRHAISAAMANPLMQIELLHVLDPMTLRLHADMSDEEIGRLHADESERVLQSARLTLDQAGIPYQVHCRVGSAANEIALQVHESGCAGVIMGTRGMGPIANIMIGSVAARTVHLVHVPVTLIK